MPYHVHSPFHHPDPNVGTFYQRSARIADEDVEELKKDHYLARFCVYTEDPVSAYPAPINVPPTPAEQSHSDEPGEADS